MRHDGEDSQGKGLDYVSLLNKCATISQFIDLANQENVLPTILMNNSVWGKQKYLKVPTLDICITVFLIQAIEYNLSE